MARASASFLTVAVRWTPSCAREIVSLNDISVVVPVSNVSFEPGCRNNWHIHHGIDGGGDQILICTAGSGWYQADGEDPISMEPGTVVRVPPGPKHWHGAKADAWFSHLAFITPGGGVSSEWLEPVTDEVYGRLPKKNGENA